MIDIQNLCKEFDLEFKVISYTTEFSNMYFIYHFGPIKWQIPFGEQFNWDAYINVSKKLAATYPEKILCS